MSHRKGEIQNPSCLRVTKPLENPRTTSLFREVKKLNKPSLLIGRKSIIQMKITTDVKGLTGGFQLKTTVTIRNVSFKGPLTITPRHRHDLYPRTHPLLVVKT